MDRFGLGVVLAAAVAVAALTAGTWSTGAATAAAPGPKALESSLLAPCCWAGTLATHDSPLATELRTEIETRAEKGEATAAIEADLVGRYGNQIKAMPRVGAFTNALVIAVDVLIAGVAALVLALGRWRAPRREVATSENASPPRDAYDDRIDAELAEL